MQSTYEFNAEARGGKCWSWILAEWRWSLLRDYIQVYKLLARQFEDFVCENWWATSRKHSDECDDIRKVKNENNSEIHYRVDLCNPPQALNPR